jgi:orotidine-5'-phosphate decarboxylase
MIEKLLAAAQRHDSWLCVGLDPQIGRIPSPIARTDPARAVWEFNRQIIDATHEFVCAYKPNIAFYEALGPRGLEALQQTREYIPDDLLVICDAKRADIASTDQAYAQALFGYYGFDAVTVNPYLGLEALEPFLGYPEKGLFVLCHTSNPGARDFQELNCGDRPLYQRVAERVASWGQYSGRLGLVVGATYPEELVEVRRIVGQTMPILVLGVGVQGADLTSAVRGGMNTQGERALISSSRSVIYSSSGQDFAQAAGRAAQHLRDEINVARHG